MEVLVLLVIVQVLMETVQNKKKLTQARKKEFIPDYQFNPYTNYVGYDQENIPRS